MQTPAQQSLVFKGLNIRTLRMRIVQEELCVSQGSAQVAPDMRGFMLSPQNSTDPKRVLI